jgi:predicted RNase H-like HicB family nuclease
MKSIRVIVEQHPDGFVAYPLGLKGVVVGQGNTSQEALDDVASAVQFHVETFGPAVLQEEAEVLDAFVLQTDVAL